MGLSHRVIFNLYLHMQVNIERRGQEMLKLIIHFTQDEELLNERVRRALSTSTGTYMVIVYLPVRNLIDGEDKCNIRKILADTNYIMELYDGGRGDIPYDINLMLTGIILETMPSHNIILSRRANSISNSIGYELSAAEYTLIGICPDDSTDNYTFVISCHVNSVSVGFTTPVEEYIVADKYMYDLLGASVYCSIISRDLQSNAADLNWIETRLIDSNEKVMQPSTIDSIQAIKVKNSFLKDTDLILLQDSTGHIIGKVLCHTENMILVKYTKLPAGYTSISQFRDLCNVVMDLSHNAKTVIVYDESKQQKEETMKLLDRTCDDKSMIVWCTPICIDGTTSINFATQENDKNSMVLHFSNENTDANEPTTDNMARLTAVRKAIRDIQYNLRIVEDFINEEYDTVKEAKQE